MRFSTQPHTFYGGLDRHARTMSVGVLGQEGEGLSHRHMTAAPDPCLRAMAPSREAIGGGVACLFTRCWLADRCARQGIPSVLGHALYMQALQGGTAKHDQLEAHKIAVRLRGGMPPQASVDPAARRATRDLLRRRMPLRRKRAELPAHRHKTHSHYSLPELGKQLADKANRAGVAERFLEPAAQQSIEGDRARIDTSDHSPTALARAPVQTAQTHEAQPLYRVRSIPGIGKLPALGLRYASHAIHRVPRGQEFVPSCRRVQCAQDSAGKKIGKASLQWAFADAAALLLRDNPAGQHHPARRVQTHGQGNASTAPAHTLARAV